MGSINYLNAFRQYSILISKNLLALYVPEIGEDEGKLRASIEKHFRSAIQQGDDDLKDDFRLVYEQSHEHARHQEWQRLTLVTILGALLAGIATSYDRFDIGNQPEAALGLFLGGLFLSLAAMPLLHAWHKAFQRHYIRSEMIVAYYMKLPYLNRLPPSKFDPAQSSVLKDFILDWTSGNVFYYIVIGLGMIYGFLIELTLKQIVSAEHAGYPWLFSLVIGILLLSWRVRFAYKEMEARNEILYDHWSNRDKFF